MVDDEADRETSDHVALDTSYTKQYPKTLLLTGASRWDSYRGAYAVNGKTSDRFDCQNNEEIKTFSRKSERERFHRSSNHSMMRESYTRLVSHETIPADPRGKDSSIECNQIVKRDKSYVILKRIPRTNSFTKPKKGACRSFPKARGMKYLHASQRTPQMLANSQMETNKTRDKYSFKEKSMTFSDRKESLLLSLNNEVKIYIFSFLTATDIRAVMNTNRLNRKIGASLYLWTEICARDWKLLRNLALPNERTSQHRLKVIQLEGDLKIPTTQSLCLKHRVCVPSKRLCSIDVSGDNVNSEQMTNNRMPFCNLALLSQLHKNHPSKIDDKYFFRRSYSTEEAVLQKKVEFKSFKVYAASKAYPKCEEVSVVQFMSTVGTGDRSICAESAFPSMAEATYHWCFKPSAFLETFIRNGCRSSFSMKPFVYPFVTKIDDDIFEKKYMIDVNPRLVSYFEVTIFPESTAGEVSTDHSSTFMRNFNTTPNFRVASECVAIGLSTEKFTAKEKMPGWDTYSYGYHGDDGGIFHANGMMLRNYGPTFGVGDTVGCGIDYINQGIFFTINGKPLGFAWTDIDLKLQYYATVGIDTRSPIEINFGTRPFAYDLKGKVLSQRQQINSHFTRRKMVYQRK